jgi:hypothetical protein
MTGENLFDLAKGATFLLIHSEYGKELLNWSWKNVMVKFNWHIKTLTIEKRLKFKSDNQQNTQPNNSFKNFVCK